MYAIVQIGGHQYKVSEKQEIFVNRLEGKKNDKITFDQVLLVDNGGKVSVGAPNVSGANVSAKIVEQLKADKVIVFKKKRRKGYKKKNGHRQALTKISIDSIVASGAKTKAKAEPKKETPKAKTAAKKTAAAPKKTTAQKADDLKKIEGIGPKIASMLTDAGYETFAKLSKAKPEQIKEILLAGGSRYKMHDPITWPKQAKLAADGKWDELKKWQDELDGGK